MEENHLFTLIKTHKWDEFKTSISEDMDLNIQDNHMNYMVQYIILANQIEILKQILKYNVVIDWIDVAGKTILYEPIRFNYTEIIDILIDKGSLHIDALNDLAKMSISVMSVQLFNLEMKGAIRALAGKRYEAV